MLNTFRNENSPHSFHEKLGSSKGVRSRSGPRQIYLLYCYKRFVFSVTRSESKVLTKGIKISRNRNLYGSPDLLRSHVGRGPFEPTSLLLVLSVIFDLGCDEAKVSDLHHSVPIKQDVCRLRDGEQEEDLGLKPVKKCSAWWFFYWTFRESDYLLLSPSGPCG